MARKKTERPVVPGRVFLLALLPFAIPAGFTLLLALGFNWPRDLAPGSGLKLAGFVATAATALAVWGYSVRGLDDRQARGMAALFCAVVGLMAWPLWSMGVLPSVNGAVVRDPFAVEMALERTEATTMQRSPEFNHWAWLAAVPVHSALQGGRYFIPKATYDRLEAERPATVTVDGGTGLLGAVVVTAIR